MKIDGISKNICTQNSFKKEKKHEFIDSFSEAVKNPDDVNDCVAVPRGIFKAYMWIMGGFALLSLAGYIPDKHQTSKKIVGIAGTIANFISAFYFSKPFWAKGVSPTVKRENVNNHNKQ